MEIQRVDYPHSVAFAGNQAIYSADCEIRDLRRDGPRGATTGSPPD
jgi:hypothetical protein